MSVARASAPAIREINCGCARLNAFKSVCSSVYLRLIFNPAGTEARPTKVRAAPF